MHNNTSFYVFPGWDEIFYKLWETFPVPQNMAATITAPVPPENNQIPLLHAVHQEEEYEEKVLPARNQTLEEMAVEKFTRICALYDTITWSGTTSSNVQTKFAELRNQIAENLRKGDYYFSDTVHQLDLLHAAVLPKERLATALSFAVQGFRSAIGETVFGRYKQSDILKDILSPDEKLLSEEEKSRTALIWIINETRKGLLYTYHFEQIRARLLKEIGLHWVYIFFGCLLLLASVIGLHALPGNIFDMKLTLVPVAICLGALGAAISVSMRVSGLVKSDIQLSDLTELGYPKSSVRLMPFLGAAFGLVTACIILGQLLAEPILASQDLSIASVSKLAFWAFVSGFSERFFPDIIDRFAAKARAAK